MGQDKFLRSNLLLLYVVGLWPMFDKDHKNSLKAKLYPYFSVFMVSMFIVFFLSGVVNIYYILEDLQTTAQNVSVSMTNLANFVKMTPFLFYKDKLRRLTSSLENDIYPLGAKFDSYKKNIIISKGKSQLKKLVILTYGILVFTCTFLSLSAILAEVNAAAAEAMSNSTNETRSRVLPFDGWFPFDTNVSPNYELTYIFQSMASMIDTLQVAAMDMFYTALLINTCCQFEILNMALRDVRQNILDERISSGTVSGAISVWRDQPTTETGLLQTNTHREVQQCSSHKSIMFNTIEGYRYSEMHLSLKNCIQYHQAILRFAEELRVLMSPIMLGVCFTITSVLCMIGFHITTLSPSDIHFMTLLGFLACEMSQLFLYCWFGNELLFKSTSVQQAAYDTEWYACDISFQRSVRLIMVRAQKPVILTAVFFSIVSLDLFSVLLRASYSYFTVLRQKHEEEDAL